MTKKIPQILVLPNHLEEKTKVSSFNVPYTFLKKLSIKNNS
jgi:hypothetical protein